MKIMNNNDEQFVLASSILDAEQHGTKEHKNATVKESFEYHEMYY